MNTNQSQTLNSTDDDTYMKLVQAEQEHTRTRWTVVTFFMSISFALFGFSFQNKSAPQEYLVMRLAALLIYWFALALFWRFATYSAYLGSCQKKMESDGRTTIFIHKEAEKARMNSFSRSFWHRLPAKWLLLGFGVLYAIGVIILWIFGW